MKQNIKNVQNKKRWSSLRGIQSVRQSALNIEVIVEFVQFNIRQIIKKWIHGVL